jgi:hypothetical protein
MHTAIDCAVNTKGKLVWPPPLTAARRLIFPADGRRLPKVDGVSISKWCRHFDGSMIDWYDVGKYLQADYSNYGDWSSGPGTDIYSTTRTSPSGSGGMRRRRRRLDVRHIVATFAAAAANLGRRPIPQSGLAAFGAIPIAVAGKLEPLCRGGR